MYIHNIIILYYNDFFLNRYVKFWTQYYVSIRRRIKPHIVSNLYYNLIFIAYVIDIFLVYFRLFSAHNCIFWNIIYDINTVKIYISYNITIKLDKIIILSYNIVYTVMLCVLYEFYFHIHVRFIFKI